MLERPRLRSSRPSHPLLRASACAALLALSGWAGATPDKAARFYEDALQRYESKDLPGAAIQLKNAIREDQRLLAAHLLLGKVLLRSGELRAAEAAFEEARKQGVSRSELMLPLGELYTLLGERKKLLAEISPAGLPPNLQAEVLTLRGSAQALQGDAAEARRSFTEARAAAPRSPVPLIAEAPLLLRQGEREPAKAAARKATELAPQSAAAWYTLGSMLHATGDLKGALAAHDQALKLEPRHVDALVSRAAVLLTLGREADAERDLAQLKTWDLRDPRASYMRATLLERRKDPAARAAYEEAASLLDAVPPGALQASEPLLLAGALAQNALDNGEKARELLKSLLSLNPRHYAGQLLLASIAVRAQDYNVAQPLLENLQRADPSDTRVMYLLGTVQMARKRYLQASELLEKAVAQGGAPEAMQALGFSQLALGQGREGLANLEKAFAANVADARAGMQLTMIYASQGQTAKAVQTAESLLKRDPANLALLNFLGNMKGRIGDKRGAREAFEQVLKKDPSFRPSVQSLAWLDMEERRFDAARARLAPLLAANRDDAEILFQTGVLEYRAGRLEQAQPLLERASELQRGDPRAGLALIEVLNEQRQSAKALEAAKALGAKYPSHLTVQVAEARAYLAAGDARNARLRLQEATKLAEFDAGKQTAIGRLQLAAGNLDGAEYNVQKALQASPDDLGALTLRVEIAAKRGQPAKVDSALAALNAKHAGSVPALITSGHVAMSRGLFPAALNSYRGAMDKAPNTATAILVTQAQLAAGDLPKALAFIEGWSAKNPADRNALKAVAELQVLAGRHDAAKASLQRLLAAEPGNASLMSRQAQVLQQLKDPGAQALAEKALAAAPDDPEVADALGWILVQRGDPSGALRHLRAARLRNPAQMDIRFHLASALAQVGRKAEAREELAVVVANAGGRALPPAVQQLRKDLGL